MNGFRVRLIPPQGKTSELAPGTTVLGRGPSFGIIDRRVSRKHAQLLVSPETNSVALVSVGVNPTFLHRSDGSNGDQALVLRKDDSTLVRNGDRISLLQDGLYQFIVQLEDPSDVASLEGTIDGDATQLDPEVHSNGKRKKSSSNLLNPSVLKRSRFAGCSQELDEELQGLSAVQIDASQIQILRTIGVGSCGEVYEGVWQGTRVAIKKIFRTLIRPDAKKEFLAEASLLRNLRHPNVVLFMGTTKRKNELSIIMEFMNRGSLRDVLEDDKLDLAWDRLIGMTTDAARGMNYLHTRTPPIIHRDLKSHNLLVDSNFTVKVTDFGLAKTMVEGAAMTFCGTMPWTAPEIFRGAANGYTTKADVYSFGIVLWELFTRQEPYGDMHKPQIIIGVTKDGLRPTIPSACPSELSSLMSDCWEDDPDKRPDFSQILHRLETMQAPPEAFIPKQVRALTATQMTQKFQATTTGSQVTVGHSWEIISTELEFLEQIGQGASAVVYKGRYRGQSVAIKVLKETLDGKHLEEFQKEVKIMSDVRSPRVVFFYGVCTSPNLCIVTEYLDRGSLHDVLQDNTQKFDWKLIFRLARESAEAVHALHNWKPSIVHRDLKSPNLLVDRHWNVKVADFGLARFTTQRNDETLSKLRGTFAYCAPESYLGQVYTPKSDVYSFGIILWEMIQRILKGEYERPFGEYKNLKFDFQIIVQTAKKGLRPTMHPECPPPVQSLITQCWDSNPEKRPTFEEILKILDEKIRPILNL